MDGGDIGSDILGGLGDEDDLFDKSDDAPGSLFDDEVDLGDDEFDTADDGDFDDFDEGDDE